MDELEYAVAKALIHAKAKQIEESNNHADPQYAAQRFKEWALDELDLIFYGRDE